ncbi:MAG TPA: TRAP transporter substrate-binding protein DctP [Bacteroidota bacterium]|jgi:TRAP-type C4-dicarboxylate transport system substrate-binding protein|nr:TRAP transporter substrate-binding protein DctP [Bacteroidota bacterium]
MIKFFRSTAALRILFVSALFVGTTLPLWSQQYTIKFATLAPEGSTWINIMKEYDQAIRKESGGRLGFKIYPGGVQGDEKDVLRKIKLGQLHSAGITGNGMTSIAPKARILDSPFLVSSYAEADYITATYDKEINQAFEDGGFINLGWAEVGFIYVFTNTPVKSPADMKNVKMWMWEGDPIAEATFRSLELHPIQLSITDVLTSLQTKLIDGVYTSPLAAIALQWFTKVKYMLNLPLADASGAVVISKKKFDELPKDLQEILLRNGKTYMAKLTQASRAENAKSLETLKQRGITVVDPPPQEVESYKAVGSQARKHLAGKLFTEELLNRVENSLTEFRKKGK